MLLPASTGSGESDLASARLAEVLTVVSSVAVLSEVSGSNTPEVVLAVLEMFVVREESTFTTRVTDLLAPLVIVFRFHPTTPAVSFFFNDTATTEIYTLSLHDALPIFASDGPLFVTVSV